MTTVRMVQIFKYKWKVVSKAGVVLKDDIFVSNQEEAERYVKSYISSFSGWSYVMEPLSAG